MSRSRTFWIAFGAWILAALPARAEWTAEQKCLQVISNFQRAEEALAGEIDYRERMMRLVGGPTTYSTPVIDTVLGQRSASMPCADSAFGAPCLLRSDEYSPFDLSKPAFVQGCNSLEPGQVGLINLGTSDTPNIGLIEIKVCRDLTFETACKESAPQAILMDGDYFWNPIPNPSSIDEIHCWEADQNFFHGSTQLHNVMEELYRYNRNWSTPITEQDAVNTFLYYYSGQGACVSMSSGLGFFYYCASPTTRHNPLNPTQFAYVQGCGSLSPGQIGIQAQDPGAEISAVSIMMCYNFQGACHRPDTLISTWIPLRD